MPHHSAEQVGAGADQIADADSPWWAPASETRFLTAKSTPCNASCTRGSPARPSSVSATSRGVAREQRDAELMLELLDRGRQCRLGDEQPLGGAPVVQLLAQQHSEVPQLMQRDIGAGGVLLVWVTSSIAPVVAPRQKPACVNNATVSAEMLDVHESWVVVRPHSRLEVLCS